ncbi:MAG: ATP-binding protein [Pseudomonadota bacterium]
MCCSAAAQQSDNVGFPTLHQLDIPSLEAIAAGQDEISRHRANLVLARRIAGRNLPEAVARIEALTEQIGVAAYPAEWVYLQAISAEIQIRSGQLDDAARALDNARPMLNRLENSSALVSFMLAEGLQQVRNGQQDKAIATYRRARFFAEAAGDAVLALHARHNEGAAQMQLGMLSAALENISAVHENIDLYPSDDLNLHAIQFNLARIQGMSGEIAPALAGFQANRPLWVEAGHLTRAFIVTTQIARALNTMGRHKEAIAELTTWLARDDIDAGPDLTADALLVLGQAYLAQGDFRLTESCIADARSIIDASNAIGRRTEFDILEASLLQAKDDLNAALVVIDASLSRISDDAPTVNTVDALVLKADILNDLGNSAAALQAQRTAMQTEREMRTAEFDQRMAAALVAIEFEGRQRELDMLRANERLSEARIERDQIFQNALIGVGALLALVAYLVWSQWHLERRARTKLEQTVDERTELMRKEMQKRVDAERAQRGLESRLVEDEKYRAVARLTAGLAHDFNNLLTVVGCSAELVKLRGEDREVKELADDILDAADSGTRVTRSLIAYARQQALHPERIRLDEFLDTNQSLFRNTLGAQVELTMDLEPATVEIDRSSLTTALLNVFFNAREAMPRHGKVRIVLREEEDAPTDRCFRLSITDNGDGMDDETLARAMEPFFSTKKTGKTSGMGLGLSTVYGFMRQSSGNVEIESIPNQGTTVHLLFPLAAASAADDVPDEMSQQRTRKRRVAPNVLLVEDQDKIRDLTRRALEAAGYRVHDCRNGSEAIEMLNGRTDFDIVVSDIVMPGPFNGIDVARTAQKVDVSMRVLLTSGHADVVPREFEFLAKPYSVATLLRRIEKLVGPAKEFAVQH